MNECKLNIRKFVNGSVELEVKPYLNKILTQQFLFFYFQVDIQIRLLLTCCHVFDTLFYLLVLSENNLQTSKEFLLQMLKCQNHKCHFHLIGNI